jgi:hypothetical protein
MRKAFLCALFVVMCLALASAQSGRPKSLVPSGAGFGVAGNGGPHVYSVHQGNQIAYHGGPIIPNTVNVYVVFYGNWKTGPHPSDSKKGKQLIKAFFNGIGGSDYFNINTTYGDNSHDVTGQVSLAGVTSMAYPYGNSLAPGSISKIVNKAISRGSFPVDDNAIYFVLTSSDVAENAGFGSFCVNYCGYHGNGTIAGKNLKYSFVGNPERCPSGCTAQPTKSPNNLIGADGMASVLAHELEEAVTDPDVTTGPYAWYFDASGNEDADQCAWKFGTLLGGQINNGGYNEQFGGHNWLIQMEWENARGGGCDNFLGGPFHNN